MNANTIQILNQYNVDIIELNLSSANIYCILDLLKFTQLKILNCSNTQIKKQKQKKVNTPNNNL